MATYYVRPDGSNTNSGLGPAANQAWATVTYALANMVLTNGTNYLYIAPGAYREAPTVTITPSSTQTLVISGDPTASQFSGLTAGVVRLTNFTSDTANPGNANILTISGKTYITITGLHFDIFTSSTNYAIQGATSPDNIIIDKCTFQGHDNGAFATYGINFVHTSIVQNITIQKCVFNRCYLGVAFESSAPAGTSQQFTSTDCLFIGCDIGCFYITGNGINRKIQNCTFVNFVRNAVVVQSGQASGTSVTNCLFSGGSTALTTSSVGITENYNRFISCSPRNNVSPSGANSVTGGVSGVDIAYGLLTGIPNQQMFSTLLNSPNFNFGTTSGAPVSDMYGVTWTGANPDAGSATYRSLSGVGSYLPTERTNNSFTVSPNTTNRTELIYLGAKGLTHTTPSLSASYVRAGAIRTAITLVSQTPNGSWISGGFCEIDSINMPGIYRIDVPNAVFVAGAESAMLQLTGTNQTNGAVVHYNMAKVQFDLSQNVPLTNTAHSIGDALNAARAQGFGKWQIVGNTMNIYAEDGITLVKSFNLDSGSYPTQRM